MIRTFLVVMLGYVLLAHCAPLGAADNIIFTELTDTGVTIAGTKTKLPPPIMGDGLDGAAQTKVLESIATPAKPVAELTRKSVVAPFVLKIDEGSGTLKRVDAFFVVYGELDRLMEDGFKKLDDGPGDAGPMKDPALKSNGELLDEKTLAARGIKVAGEHETIAHSYFPIFDRLKLHATLRSIDTRGKDSVLLAAKVDERFNKDEKYGNFWQALKRDDAGKLSIAPAQHPYTAAISYAKATQLVEPKGAIFVEYHLAFEEPAGWFNGAKLLTSKLPIAAQSNIRKLRQQLEKEAK